MNSRGDIYEGPPKNADDIPLTKQQALDLKLYNRRTRRIVYAEVKKGYDLATALHTAVNKLRKY